MKIGVLGGTFNPPHWGHFLIAQAAIKYLGLEKLILIPSAVPPLKSEDLASTEDRLAMTKLLTKLDTRLIISKIEIERAESGEKSFTIDTLKELRIKYPDAEINWIIGADALIEIIRGKWRGGLSLFEMADFVVVTRPGYNLEEDKFPPEIQKTASEILLKIKQIKLNISISSTEIRDKIRAGQDIKDLVPPNILNYIQKKKLYGFKKDLFSA